MMKRISIVVALVLMAGVAHATDLAKVNGTTITDKDLKSALAGMNEKQRDAILKDSNSRRQILMSLIDQEVLAQQAIKEKLDQDAEYKEALDMFRKQYLGSRVMQKALGAKITEAAAKDYYESHKTRYSTDTVHAMHILVDTEEKARELMTKAKEKGVDFQDLAEKNSKDPSAKNNRGDLGYFGRDRMVPEFTQAAFGGNKGEIVGPVRTSYGYHIIKIVDKKLGKPMEYGEVELRVKSEMRSELMREYVAKVRGSAKVVVEEKNLK